MPSALIPSLCLPAVDGGDPVELTGAPGWQLYRLGQIAALPDWPETTSRADDFWISRDVLTYLNAHPQSVTTELLLVRNATLGRDVLLTKQVFEFRAGRQIRHTAGAPASRWNFRRRLLSLFSAKVLCIGQLLTSGDYAVDAGEADAETVVALALAAGSALARLDGVYRAVLLKDLIADPDNGIARNLLEHAYTRLPADPVMVTELGEFRTFEDYLARLTSKYRVRYRRARGKLEGLRRSRLNTAQAKSHLPRIFELYRETSGGADVNLVSLHPEYFLWLAGVGRLHGYFDHDGQLVGFTTAIANGPVYQAHYLGLRDSYKDTHALYHNMLFDLLRDAIEGGFDRLDYGRTALEIKSSVGAEPRIYGSWLRVIPGWLNRLVPGLLPVVFEARDWTPRNPYKADT